jgi:hypothetical protein
MFPSGMFMRIIKNHCDLGSSNTRMDKNHVVAHVTSASVFLWFTKSFEIPLHLEYEGNYECKALANH